MSSCTCCGCEVQISKYSSFILRVRTHRSTPMPKVKIADATTMNAASFNQLLLFVASAGIVARKEAKMKTALTIPANSALAPYLPPSLHPDVGCLPVKGNFWYSRSRAASFPSVGVSKHVCWTMMEKPNMIAPMETNRPSVTTKAASTLLTILIISNSLPFSLGWY